MLRVLKAAWADPVWSKVIAGGILAALGAVGVSFAGWWPSVGRALADFWFWLATTSRTANWLLLLMGLAVAILLAQLVVKVKAALKPRAVSRFVLVYETDMHLMWKLRP
jgi:hypothetical protein